MCAPPAAALGAFEQYDDAKAAQTTAAVYAYLIDEGLDLYATSTRSTQTHGISPPFQGVAST